MPLSLPVLMRLSPATDAALSQINFSHQFARAAAGEVPTVADAPPICHPISIAPEQTARGAALFAAFAIFLIGAARLTSVVGARVICLWLVGLGTILAVVGIVQRGLTATDVRPLIYGFWQPRSPGAVPFGPFVNPNHFAGWMLMSLPVALGAWLDALLQAIEGAPRRGDRIALVSSPRFGMLLTLATACFLMGLSLLMTRSRSGLAAFAVGGATVGFVMIRTQATRATRISVAAAVVTLLLGTAMWAGVDTVTSKFTEEQSLKSFDSRVNAWRDTIDIIRDFPLTGSGLDTYGTAMMVYQTDNRRLHYGEAHNDYLQLAAEGGLLVGIPILATIGVFVRDIRRRFREAPKIGSTYCLRVGAVAGLVSIALQSIVEFSLQMPGNAALFAVLAAIALHQSPNLPTAPASKTAARS